MKRKFLIWIALAILFLLPAILLVPRMGTYLVRQDKLEKADAMVILMGNIPDRALETYDLYEMGYASEIIIVMANRYGIDVFRKRGIPLDGQTSITQKVLIGLGVPDSIVTILPGDAKSTQDEALEVRNYVEKIPDLDTLILVTSSYHSRRAAFTFEKELSHLDRPTVLISCPSKYTGFHSEIWWKDRESAKLVFFEYLKLTNMLLFW